MGEQIRERAALESALSGMGRVAVAVSGGVDSLTLASFAHRLLGADCEMYHAVSPAVPGEATQRAQLLACREGWALHIIDAGEFESAEYMRNPVNRCFHCKTSLYGAISPRTVGQVVSGTNIDDLGEYRPGLIAAREHGVRHPFVEAGMNKRAVRELSRALGLGEVAELPSAPCLSSRIETGIAIDSAMLARVHQTERLIGAALQPETVRCGVRARGVVIELDEASLRALDAGRREELAGQISGLFGDGGFAFAVSFEPYRVGSAFLHFKAPAR